VSSPIQSACAGERRETIGMVIDQTTFCFFATQRKGRRCNECNEKTKLKKKVKVKVKVKGNINPCFFAFDFGPTAQEPIKINVQYTDC